MSTVEKKIIRPEETVLRAMEENGFPGAALSRQGAAAVITGQEKGGMTLIIYVAEDGDVLMDAAIGPAEREEQVLDTLNFLNALYRYIKLYAAENGQVVATYDFLLPESPEEAKRLAGKLIRWFAELARK